MHTRRATAAPVVGYVHPMHTPAGSVHPVHGNDANSLGAFGALGALGVQGENR
jgi:hypothetical protein